jgi:dUTP pyrophosphatase
MKEKCKMINVGDNNTIVNSKINGIIDMEEDKMKMKIKYFEGATKLKRIQCGNWIDVYANKDVFVPVGERAMIPLGFALELPQGWEGHLAPRSSTFKTWGIIQTNHVGIVDDSYIGDNDQWHMPVYCLQGHKYVSDDEGNPVIADNCIKTEKSCELTADGTWIRQGDKIGQFRIMEVMPEIQFEEVESFGNVDRGGFGTTSSR